MTPRESALGCDDILATIFDHLAPVSTDGNKKTEESRRSCRKALASSAVACTTLSHHALNVLWRELESVHPLLKTLPNCKCVDLQWTLSGAISDEYWTRFQFYADRVRAIVGSLEPELMDPIHPSVWLFLAARCKGSPLMPRLRYLLALDLRLSETSALVLLLSPSLRKLDIFFALDEEMEELRIAPHVASSLLQTLPLMAPNLESFFCHVDISLGRGHGYIGAFRQFARLNTLSISSKLALDEGALRMLSAIATLRDLSCSIDLSSSSALTQRPYTFQHLTGLNVRGPFDDLTAFIDACQLPSLTGITLRINQPPSAREPVASFAAVCRRCNPALLTSFRIEVNYPFPSPRPHSLLQYFEPLLAFPNIKNFHLSFSRAMPSIHDDDLARFGGAWPRLSTFRISHFSASLMPRQGPQPVPEVVRPTLSGLIDLARRCPHLDSLRVPELDANVVPDKNAALPIGHGLRTFYIDNAMLPSPESPMYSEAATVLNRVFPSIDLKSAQSMVRSHAKGWKQFLGLLETMRLRRKDSEDGLDAADLAARPGQRQ